MHQRPVRQLTGHSATTVSRFLWLCVFIAGCHSEDRTPTVIFTKVPSANPGGPDTSGVIEGQVRGARSGQKVVLYAKAHSWWVQPAAEKPFTDIDAQGRWSSATHLGTEYAALLVDVGYRPSLITESLPGTGEGVVAVASVKAVSVDKPKATQVLHFSDYDWEVSTTPNSHRGTMHSYESANVHLDPNGFLHLRITKQQDQWSCSQLSLTRSLGYGTYKFVVQDVSKLEPAAVLDLYTWNFSDIEQNRRELDISLSRFGDPEGKNAEYVVQPFYVPQNVSTFSVDPGLITYSMEWRQSVVSFAAIRGTSGLAPRKGSNSHVFTSGIPSPGGETAHMNFCTWNSGKVPMHDDAEVVIEKFQYLP